MATTFYVLVLLLAHLSSVFGVSDIRKGRQTFRSSNLSSIPTFYITTRLISRNQLNYLSPQYTYTLIVSLRSNFVMLLDFLRCILRNMFFSIFFRSALSFDCAQPNIILPILYSRPIVSLFVFYSTE